MLHFDNCIVGNTVFPKQNTPFDASNRKRTSIFTEKLAKVSEIHSIFAMEWVELTIVKPM